MVRIWPNESPRTVTTFSTSVPGERRAPLTSTVTEPSLAGCTQQSPLQSHLCWGPLPCSPALGTTRGLGSEPTVGLVLPPPTPQEHAGVLSADTRDRHLWRTPSWTAHPPPQTPSYLQPCPVHILGQFDANSVGDNEGVIRIDLWGEETAGSLQEAGVCRDQRAEPKANREVHTCAGIGHTHFIGNHNKRNF